MNEDVEMLLRTAFRQHGEAITPATLRHPDMRRAAKPDFLRPALASICVVAVAGFVFLGVGALRTGHTDRPGATPKLTPSSYLGYTWRLATIAHGGQATLIPKNLVATVLFLADGTIVLSDTVNALNGKYTFSADGFSVRDLSTTLVGYSGNDSLQTMVLDAIHATGSGSLVRAQITGAELRLSVAGYRLVFHRPPDRKAPTVDPSRTSR